MENENLNEALSKGDVGRSVKLAPRGLFYLAIGTKLKELGMSHEIETTFKIAKKVDEMIIECLEDKRIILVREGQTHFVNWDEFKTEKKKWWQLF